jgi:hypothetical protein
MGVTVLLHPVYMKEGSSVYFSTGVNSFDVALVDASTAYSNTHANALYEELKLA